MARERGARAVLNLDSLMDILSCLVGVMLFLVIYTVLELGSATYEAALRIPLDPPPGSDRVIILADRETVRILDIGPPLEELLSGFEIVERLEEVPLFVDAIQANPADDFFRYRLTWEERLSTNLAGTLDLHVEERPAVVGDSIHQLGEASRYAAALARLDPSDTWLAFAVDSNSVDVFRRAREIAISMGFATGWDLLSLELPLVVPLSEGREGIELDPSSSKPLR